MGAEKMLVSLKNDGVAAVLVFSNLFSQPFSEFMYESKPVSTSCVLHVLRLRDLNESEEFPRS